jgi:hypothetical protein
MHRRRKFPAKFFIRPAAQAVANTTRHSCCVSAWLLLACLQVLLSDQSGFLPAVYRAQGNELVSLTPWQVRKVQQYCVFVTLLHGR